MIKQYENETLQLKDNTASSIHSLNHTIIPYIPIHTSAQLPYQTQQSSTNVLHPPKLYNSDSLEIYRATSVIDNIEQIVVNCD